MKNLFCLLFLACVSVAYSAPTTEIEYLRAQSSTTELTDSQKGLIATFWAASLDELMLAESSKDCVETRRQIAMQKGDDHQSNFAIAFVDEANRSIEAAFSHAQRMEDAHQGQMAQQNLMILAAELKSPKLARLGLDRLDSEDVVIQYWAYKAVTDSSVLQQLTSSNDTETTQAILKALNERVSGDIATPIQRLIIRFCMGIDDPLARDILLSLADARIQAYRDWTVTDEVMDVTLLTALGNLAMLREQPDRAAFGQKFAELYALTMQRYLKGKDNFSKSQIGDLMTVIAEVDQSVLMKQMGIKTGILASLKRKMGLEREYEVLFGDRMRSGQLAEMFTFDYGKDASGKPITVPQELDPMPE
jgi:hypothetical protein